MSEKEKKFLDLSALDTKTMADQGVEMEILTVDSGKPTGVFLTLAGYDSDIYRNQERATLNRRLAKKVRKTPTAEDFDDDSMVTLVRCTLGWRNVEVGGKPLEFTPANVRMVYEQYPEIKRQANAFILDGANFLRD
ncbi:hypothetical protein SAMN04488503_2290 [Humidesulfovibrio mexicanus]|uniref:Tail assembly chaperone n=1 Tax=Humidesulfovibrio mexicanus TaxID=147047 RepID=A0A239AXT1_9BACT|nr:hypothetical protein [Humidesulfovibrio mexicanus]SNS00360.1 hypothetical protein SAMN04488503_2290 [Humidesulfovibrio mexicanus]